MPEISVNTRTVLHPGGVVVPGVTVSLYDDSAVFQTTAVTDVNGLAFLGNQSVGTYEIRITPPPPAKVVDGLVQNIVVVGAVALAFQVLIDTSDLPAATNANLCRCSGVFLDSYGNAVKDVSIVFSEETLPVLLYTASSDSTTVVIPRTLSIRTNSDGYASIDLIREAEYSVFMEGYQNIARVIRVPNLTAAPLPDVLFPVVDRVEFSDSGTTLTPVASPTLSLSVSQKKTLTLTTVFRSGMRVSGLSGLSLDLDSVDTSILSVSLTDDGLLLEALTADSTTIEAKRIDSGTGTGISIYPEPALRGTLNVTATA